MTSGENINSLSYWDNMCRRTVGLSVESFLVKYDSGEFDDYDCNSTFGQSIFHLEMSLPFIRALKRLEDSRA